MLKQFFILLFVFAAFIGCQQETKKYEGEQVWIGRYNHPANTDYTIYTFTYNKNKPKMTMKTFNNKNEKQKESTRELIIAGQEKQFTILVPLDMLNRSDYNVKTDSLKFTITSENQAQITSYDETFVIQMERKTND